ncbi:hypothetical protein NFIA_056710 [Paecilomyces variotii No. 5]|uniref:Trafficking PGA2-domain-containing protein n=1 Tax=Byssochlamys spectabilis (strain No. 5 / NBRC 109023) TaxID=1356009 RepID=V5FXH2_BYSSN|nr:hypothetical protein NFIA_056710 [Paecilomyces variotii No. 5]
MADYTPPTASDLLADFFNQIFGGIEDWYTNLYTNLTSVSAKRWIRMGVIVGTYLLVIRPLLDMFFRWSFDKKQTKEKQKKEEQQAAFGAEGKTAKVSPNSLRGPGKVLGEVETDDEDTVKESGKSTGVPEMGKSARKRQKKQMKEAAKNAGVTTDGMTEEELLELLDWSESDEEK